MPHSQLPATCLYPEPAQSSLYPYILLLEDPTYIILAFRPCSRQWSLSLRFPHQKSLHASPITIRATRPAHLILLHFITRKIVSEELGTIKSQILDSCFDYSVWTYRKVQSQSTGSKMERDSSVGIATGYGLEGLEIETMWGRNFPHRSRPTLRPTQPPIQWVSGHFPGG
jgi:hypothetical protein